MTDCQSAGTRRQQVHVRRAGRGVLSFAGTPHSPRMPAIHRIRRLAVTGITLLGASACAMAPVPATSVAPTDARQVINPPGISPLVPAYSVAIRDGGQLFVSGMTGVVPGSQEIIAGGITAQTRQTLVNIQSALTMARATMADVAECTVFLVDMGDYAAMNAVYQTFFATEPPARATVAVSALPRPAARVEIKCSALLPRR